MEIDGDADEQLEAAAAYVLTGKYVCHECRHEASVFAVLLEGPFKSVGEEFVEDGDRPLLRNVTDLPEHLAAIFTAKSLGNFRPDFSHTAGERYWMNHCSECGAKIGDWFVGKPGEAFFPTSDAEMSTVQGTRVEGPFCFANPTISLSSWTSEWLRRFPGNVSP